MAKIIEVKNNEAVLTRIKNLYNAGSSECYQELEAAGSLIRAHNDYALYLRFTTLLKDTNKNFEAKYYTSALKQI